MSTRLPSGKELVALRLLRDRPHGMYGLELVNASKGKLGRAAVYVTLGRMEVKGFVKRQTPPAEEKHPGLPRPHYRITALGEKVLRAVEAAQGVMRTALARVGA
jgi:DNA-binding PadR family transcriptional regulator